MELKALPMPAALAWDVQFTKKKPIQFDATSETIGFAAMDLVQWSDWTVTEMISVAS